MPNPVLPDRIFRIAAACFLLAFALGSPVSHAEILSDEEIYRQVDRIKSQAKTIGGQADALAELTWGEADTPPQVRAYARNMLVGYGQRGMNSIRAIIRRGATPYSADATMALVQSFNRETSGLPSHYLPGLDEAIWFGTIEARRIAMIELMRHAYPPSMIPTIDTAYEFPPLRSLCIQAIALHRDEGARHFLQEVLEGDHEAERLEAAVALATIGGRGLTSLKDAALSSRPEVREAGVRAFLPLATVDDLSTLYGYLEAAESSGGEDSPVTVRVRDRVSQLEQKVREELLEDLQQDAEESPFPPDQP